MVGCIFRSSLHILTIAYGLLGVLMGHTEDVKPGILSIFENCMIGTWNLNLNLNLNLIIAYYLLCR